MTDKEPGIGFTMTGASNSRIHLAEFAPWQTHALCGVGIYSEVNEYRPSRARLERGLCSKCKRIAKQRGIDPFTLGVRDDDD